MEEARLHLTEEASLSGFFKKGPYDRESLHSSTLKEWGNIRVEREDTLSGTSFLRNKIT